MATSHPFDRRRFDRVVLPHLDRLVAFARRLGAGDAEVDDWVQDAVMRAWRASGQLADERSVRAWLFQILRGVATDDARSRARRRGLVDVIALEERHEEMVASDAPDPLEALLTSATAASIQAALDSIPEEFAQAVELHDLHELKYREIAVRPVSCWRTTLQGEAVSAWAYRWGNRVIIAYVVPEALFFRQPQVRDAVARDGRYTVPMGTRASWRGQRSGRECWSWVMRRCRS
jgi:RNA polymerase sigma-70 factor (ECF subfamily)